MVKAQSARKGRSDNTTVIMSGRKTRSMTAGIRQIKKEKSTEESRIRSIKTRVRKPRLPSCPVDDNNIIIETDPEVQNPLYIPNILERVFEYLRVRDLKQCRQVCQTWMSEVDRTVKTKGIEYKIDMSEAFEFKVWEGADDNKAMLPSSIHISKIPLDHPSVQLLLLNYGYFVQRLTFQSTKLTVKFLREHLRQNLPNLRTLILNNISYIGQTAVANQLFHDEFSLPNLKTLIVDDMKVDPNRSANLLRVFISYPTHIEDVVRGCPNLTELEITDCPSKVLANHRLTKREVQKCNWSTSLKSLRLKTKGPWNPSMIRLFRDLRLTEEAGFLLGEKTFERSSLD